MTTIRARTFYCEQSEENILHRLGAALALHWNMLPEVTRVALLYQSAMLHDDDAGENPKGKTAQLRNQIELFIDRHKETC